MAVRPSALQAVAEKYDLDEISKHGLNITAQTGDLHGKALETEAKEQARLTAERRSEQAVKAREMEIDLLIEKHNLNVASATSLVSIARHENPSLQKLHLVAHSLAIMEALHFSAKLCSGGSMKPMSTCSEHKLEIESVMQHNGPWSDGYKFVFELAAVRNGWTGQELCRAGEIATIVDGCSESRKERDVSFKERRDAPKQVTTVGTSEGEDGDQHRHQFQQHSLQSIIHQATMKRGRRGKVTEPDPKRCRITSPVGPDSSPLSSVPESPKGANDTAEATNDTQNDPADYATKEKSADNSEDDDPADHTPEELSFDEALASHTNFLEETGRIPPRSPDETRRQPGNAMSNAGQGASYPVNHAPKTQAAPSGNQTNQQQPSQPPASEPRTSQTALQQPRGECCPRQRAQNVQQQPNAQLAPQQPSAQHFQQQPNTQLGPQRPSAPIVPQRPSAQPVLHRGAQIGQQPQGGQPVGRRQQRANVLPPEPIQPVLAPALVQAAARAQAIGAAQVANQLVAARATLGHGIGHLATVGDYVNQAERNSRDALVYLSAGLQAGATEHTNDTIVELRTASQALTLCYIQLHHLESLLKNP